jgi:hypothetical protein
VADTSAGNANGNAANGITDDGSPFTASPRASLDEPAESSAAGAAAATSASGDMPESSAKLNKPHLTMSIPTDASGTRTPKSFRWNDDLDSPYSRKVSIDVADIPPEGGTKRMYKLSKRFNAGALSEAWATVEDSDELDNFRPHVIHAPHKPFPVAMACRRPQGMPGHQDIRNPQNAAWLAGCRYAQRQVFIQTPTLNARPIVRAIKQACRRGVEVVLLLDLGFNDKGESIPFQGGTNEQVVDRLYKKLGPEGKAKFLKVYWYTGKDQIRPLNAVKKQRNCHIKLAIFDDEVAVLGNGNQDTQSWFHSQEINVMIDSKQVVKELRESEYISVKDGRIVPLTRSPACQPKHDAVRRRRRGRCLARRRGPHPRALRRYWWRRLPRRYQRLYHLCQDGCKVITPSNLSTLAIPPSLCYCHIHEQYISCLYIYR